VGARIIRDVCEEFDLASAPPTNGARGTAQPVVSVATKAGATEAAAPEAKGQMFGAATRRHRFSFF